LSFDDGWSLAMTHNEWENSRMNVTGGEALVEQLALEGVTDVFGVPGVQLDWATDALRKAKDRIHFYVPRHEQATSYMADGYARVSGRPGVCMVVPGPGLLNATAGLATAYSCNSPVVCIAGHINSSAVDQGRGLLHEIKNQAGVLGAVTKWNGRARSVSEIPALVREAFRQATSGRPQPVGIEIPHDLLQGKAEIALVTPDGQDGRIRPQPAAIDAAAAMLDGARFPVIYVGGGVQAAGAAAELRELAEALDAAVVLGENGRGALSDRHPLALNAVGGRAVFPHADVALIVGSRFIDTTTGQPILQPGKTRFIFLNADPASWASPNSPALTVHADAKLGLAALAASVRRRTPSRAADVAKVRDWIGAQIAPLEPQRSWLRALRTSLPDDGIFVNELTQVGYVARSHFPVYEPGTYLSPGYQGTLGYGFPTSLGAAVAAGGKPVVAITGDGGFGWAMQELATAARYRLNVTVVLFSDGRFGNVRTFQRQKFGESFGDELYNPDFCLLAAAFGVRHARVDTPEALEQLLPSVMRDEGPTLIEVPVGEMPSPWHVMRLAAPPTYVSPPNPLGDP
jgi:acetolactate synthase-1/2/3 large subunit